MSSNNQVDSGIRGWFAQHRLPYTTAIAAKLDNIGTDLCVEDLKLLEPLVVADLFNDEKLIVKLRAEVAWEDLGGRDTFNFKKAAINIPINSVPLPPKANSSTTNMTSNNKSDNDMKSAAGQITLTKRRRADIFARATCAEKDTSLLEAVADNWVKSGQQDNLSRVAVYTALKGGYSRPDIVRFIRLKVYTTKRKPWNGVVKHDKKFMKIEASIGRIAKAMKNGKMEEVLKSCVGQASVLKSKSIKPGARGRKVGYRRRQVSDINHNAEDLQKEVTSDVIVDYSPQQLGTMFEPIAGVDDIVVDNANDIREEFQEDNDVSLDVRTA